MNIKLKNNYNNIQIQEISKEFNYFYKSIFKKSIKNKEIESAYTEACLRLIQKYELTIKNIAIDKIISKNLDVESIEIYLRLSHGKNILTQKFNILLHLLEVDPVHQAYFTAINKQHLLLTFLQIIKNIIPLPFKYLKGLYISRRHSIV